LIDELRTSAVAAGRAIANAFASGVVEGKRFEDLLRRMRQRRSTVRKGNKPSSGQ
jgi:hypothetical protein